MKDNFYDWLKDQDSSLLRDAAISYAEQGWKVGPLITKGNADQRGKRPNGAACPHGVSDFRSDPNMIRAWWRIHPGSNIGLKVPDGCVVIDIDCAEGKTGYEDWDHITDGHELPETLECRSGTGGRHIYYQLQHAGELKGKISPHIDLKHGNAYMVSPPSLHPSNRIRYQWASVAPIAPLPDFLVPHIYRKPEDIPMIARSYKTIDTDNRKASLIEALAMAQKGERNHILFWTACRHYEDNLDIEQELINTAQMIGLNDDEIAATLRSAEGRYR